LKHFGNLNANGLVHFNDVC